LITGICPKCGKKGYQNIHRVGLDKKDSPRQYLEYLHDTPSGRKRCHIGRVRTSVEALEEFNEET